LPTLKGDDTLLRHDGIPRYFAVFVVAYFARIFQPGIDTNSRKLIRSIFRLVRLRWSAVRPGSSSFELRRQSKKRRLIAERRPKLHPHWKPFCCLLGPLVLQIVYFIDEQRTPTVGQDRFLRAQPQWMKRQTPAAKAPEPWCRSEISFAQNKTCKAFLVGA
jgi:hypothetical protein